MESKLDLEAWGMDYYLLIDGYIYVVCLKPVVLPIPKLVYKLSVSLMESAVRYCHLVVAQSQKKKCV